MLFPLLLQNLEMALPAVCNNASWALGELVMHLDPVQVQPFVESIMQRLISLINDKSEKQHSLVRRIDLTSGNVITHLTLFHFRVDLFYTVRECMHHHWAIGLQLSWAHGPTLRPILQGVVLANAPSSKQLRARKHVSCSMLDGHCKPQGAV